MVFAFRYPLILGVGMYLAIRFLPTDKVPGMLPATIYHFGVAMATVRSIFVGVLEIYGTTNRAMVTAYTIIALVFVIVGVGLYLFILIKGIREKRKNSQRLTIE